MLADPVNGTQGSFCWLTQEDIDGQTRLLPKQKEVRGEPGGGVGGVVVGLDQLWEMGWPPVLLRGL